MFVHGNFDDGHLFVHQTMGTASSLDRCLPSRAAMIVCRSSCAIFRYAAGQSAAKIKPVTTACTTPSARSMATRRRNQKTPGN